VGVSLRSVDQPPRFVEAVTRLVRSETVVPSVRARNAVEAHELHAAQPMARRFAVVLTLLAAALANAATPKAQQQSLRMASSEVVRSRPCTPPTVRMRARVIRGPGLGARPTACVHFRPPGPGGRRLAAVRWSCASKAAGP
jgi:hypothetical protein